MSDAISSAPSFERTSLAAPRRTRTGHRRVLASAWQRPGLVADAGEKRAPAPDPRRPAPQAAGEHVLPRTATVRQLPEVATQVVGVHLPTVREVLGDRHRRLLG